MTRHDEMDPKLHDYLDGRLSEPEREELEARLKRDPELAAEAEFLLRLRRVLREAPSDLPTGFLARARARYEESRTVRRLRPRFVSGQAAGLAAAALLVAAILIPYYRHVPTSTAPEEMPRLSQPAAPPSSPEKKAPLGKDEKKPKIETQPAEELSRGRPVPEEAASNVEAIRSSEQEEPVAAPPPDVRKDSGAPTQMEDRIARRDEDYEKAASPTPRAQQNADLLKTVAAREGLAEPHDRIPRVEPLPANSLPPETLHIVRAADDPVWSELIAGPAAGSLLRLHPDFEHERVVLIGPRPTPFSCTGLGVAYDPGVVRIRPASPGAGESRASGCAVVLPSDTRRVEIVDPSHAPP